MKVRILLVTVVALVAILALSACGGGVAIPSANGGGSSSTSGGGASASGNSGPATVNDIPVYPGATELKAGDSKIGDTLSKNSQQITAMSQSMGAGGKTEQKGFTLPKDASWDAVKKFYDDKLTSAGWSAPSGMVANVLAQTNTQNDAFQMAMYQRSNQNLSIIRVVTDPTTNEVTLIYSLTTH